MHARRLLAVLAFAALALAVAGSLVADGGAPAIQRDGAREERPRVERWTLVSSAADDSGGWMCDEQHPCDVARQRAHAGDACAWSARVWLASPSSLALRDVRVVVFALAAREGGASAMSTFPLAWEGGWWWRAEGERIDVAVPVPCDAVELTVTINLEGRTLFGGLDALAQSADVPLRAG